jgi:voltage-gated potassium channel
MTWFTAPRRKERPRKEVSGWRVLAFTRFSEAVDRPLMILAFLMIPIIIVPLVTSDLPPGVSSSFVTLDYLIWTIFVIEYLIKVTLAPRRGHYVTHNVPDLVVVAVPMLRPLRLLRSARVLRLARLTRLSAFTGEGVTKSKHATHVEGVKYVVIITSALILITSLVVYDLERDVHGSTIHSWSDGLWWAIATVTTVGYGDKVPLTAGGRAVAVVLMLTGIALLGVITAALATYFVKQSRLRDEAAAADDRESIDGKLDILLDRVAHLEALLADNATAPNQHLVTAARATIADDRGTTREALDTTFVDWLSAYP